MVNPDISLQCGLFNKRAQSPQSPQKLWTEKQFCKMIFGGFNNQYF